MREQPLALPVAVEEHRGSTPSEELKTEDHGDQGETKGTVVAPQWTGRDVSEPRGEGTTRARNAMVTSLVFPSYSKLATTLLNELSDGQ